MRAVTCLLLLLLLTACTVAETPSPLPMESPLASPGDVSRPAPSLPAGVVLILQRSGGFAGVSEQWTIYADGAIEANDGRRWQAAPEEVARLVAEIEQAGFFDLDSRYVPFDTCCDRFTYELTVRSGERSHTVTVLEGTPDVPQALWDALGATQSFLTEATE